MCSICWKEFFNLLLRSIVQGGYEVEETFRNFSAENYDIQEKLQLGWPESSVRNKTVNPAPLPSVQEYVYLFKQLVKEASRDAIREINHQRPLPIRSNLRRVVSCFSFLLKLHLT